jgi:hypothetical protein
MSYLERLQAKATTSASREPAKGAEPPSDPFGSDPRALVPELPAGCVSGLRRLRLMANPRLLQPDVWPLVVADAIRLTRDGWAVKAMALGWTDRDLFGAVFDPTGDAAGDGLAVWLAGRKLLALTSDYAVVEDDGGGRSYFTKRVAEGVVLLWEIGSSGSRP